MVSWVHALAKWSNGDNAQADESSSAPKDINEALKLLKELQGGTTPERRPYTATIEILCHLYEQPRNQKLGYYEASIPIKGDYVDTKFVLDIKPVLYNIPTQDLGYLWILAKIYGKEGIGGGVKKYIEEQNFDVQVKNQVLKKVT